MNLVLSTYQLQDFGGTASYTVTVAEHLQRLGHDVVVYAPALGVAADRARERGLVVVGTEAELADVPELVLAQDALTSLELAARFPETPQVFVVHTDDTGFDKWMPPQIPGVVAAVIALNGRYERHIRSFAHVPEVVRLRQPVDTVRFRPRGQPRREARRVLMLGNYVSGPRRDLVFAACAEAGLECKQVGYKSDNPTVEPEEAMGEADIVIGKARVIIEAMACGRAAYVYDHNGGDGWVTPERYALLEADNFGGQAEPTAIDRERLCRDLASYTSEMGVANRDLAVANHSAVKHAHALVALFKRIAPRRERIDAPLRELARLVRLQHEADALPVLVWKADVARQEADAARKEAERLRSELAQAHADLVAVQSTRRFRFAATMAKPLDVARGLRTRTKAGS